MKLMEKVVADACRTDNPYEFTVKDSGGGQAMAVKLLMPLGGAESGLYRSPKAGESVLIGEDDSSGSTIRYLMGYLPNNSEHNAFDRGGVEKTAAGTEPVSAKMEELINESAEVFRFKQTGKTVGNEKDERYSEIGFYQKKTAWQAADNEKEAYGVVGAEHPKIDRLNIHSTGDIHQSAVNHQRTSAKRFELLVDCETDGSPSEYDEKKPFGDRSGDDSTLYAGDAHIRAKNRIVIKAGESIELQVGRSSIIISDQGIVFASRKTKSNVYNPWDTVLALKASRGIAMFGQHLDMAGGVDYTLSEGYGGSISSRLGIVRLNGFDVRAETLNTFNYLVRGVGNGADFLINAGTLSAGIVGTESNKYTGQLSTKSALPFFASKGSSVASAAGDFKSTITGMVNIVVLILLVVELALEKAIPKAYRDNYGRDGLYSAIALVEYGFLLAAFYEMCTPSLPDAIFESSIHLTSHAEVLIDSVRIHDSCREKTSGNTPLGGVSSKEAGEAYKEGLSRFKDNLLTKLAGKSNVLIGLGALGATLGLGAITAGVAYGVSKTMPNEAELLDQLRRL